MTTSIIVLGRHWKETETTVTMNNDDDGDRSSANDDYCNLEESIDYDRANDDSRKDSSGHNDDGCM